jgi:hypothetical protein
MIFAHVCEGIGPAHKGRRILKGREPEGKQNHHLPRKPSKPAPGLFSKVFLKYAGTAALKVLKRESN